MSIVPYDFERGKYRAFVRTAYKNGNNEIENVDGNKFEFESTNERIFGQLKNFDNYEDATSSTRGYTWPHSNVYDELTNTNTISSHGETMTWERLQFIVPTEIGREMKLSFEFCCPEGMRVTQNWGKQVFASSTKATSSTHEPYNFNKLGYAQITNTSASQEFVHYEFTFTPIGEETYIIFDFSADEDFYTRVQKFRNIELAYTTIPNRSESKSLLKVKSAVLMAQSVRLSFYPYDFERGKYRAYVRSEYRNGSMQENTVDSNKFVFDSIRGPIVEQIFDNGIFNAVIAKTFDITHRQIARGGSNEWATTQFMDDRLSQYYLTDWCLVISQTNASEFYQDGLYIKKYHAAGVSGICLFIPINRKYGVKSVKAIARLAEGTGGGWDIFGIGCAYVDANNQIHYGWTGTQYPSYGPSDWQEFIYNVSSSYPYIDYIVLNGCDGVTECKTIETIIT